MNPVYNFLKKDVKAGLVKTNSCGKTEHSYQSHAWAVLKSLISPKEATEAKSPRSYLKFQGHCGILATGFAGGRDRDHTTYPSA